MNIFGIPNKIAFLAYVQWTMSIGHCPCKEYFSMLFIKNIFCTVILLFKFVHVKGTLVFQN